jgi:hypothetical protein
VLWIAAHEISPFKSYPGFHRYMVPVAPLFVILGTAFFYELAQRRWPQWSGAAASIVILLAALPALYGSYRIAGAPEENLRRIVPPLVLQDTPDAAFEPYARLGVKVGQITLHGRPPLKPTALLVTSNLAYARYGALATADLQGHEIRGLAARYAELFRRPYLEVSNGRPTFAFFNPVLRIVAVDGDATHLERLAAALRGEYPGLRLTLVNAGG